MVVLGILAGEASDGDEPFGKETKYFSRIIELAGKRGMLAYVFAQPMTIDLGQPVTGLGPARAGAPARGSGWVRQQFPCPQVVYDRLSPSSDAERAATISLRKQAEATGIRFVDSPAFLALAADKWLTHTVLDSHPVVRAYLPETARFSPRMLLDMLDRSAHVYVKPAMGRQTRGVVSIRRSSAMPGQYEIHRVEQDGQVVSTTVGRDELGHAVSGSGNGSSGHVIQRAVMPATFLSMRFEIRVMMHKRPGGQWLRTAMVIRAGDAALPFLVSGRERHFRPSSVMPKVFGRRAKQVLDAVRDLSRPVPSLLERNSGSAGEVAVDIIVDAAGRPWLLEVNSRPASLLLNVGSVRLRNLGIERILDYAQSLV